MPQIEVSLGMIREKPKCRLVTPFCLIQMILLQRTLTVIQ